MMRLLIAKNLVKLNLLFLFFNFLIPSNFSRTFTGLPITSEINLIFLFIFFPIIFSKIDLIKFKFLTFILLFLTIIKIFLILAPNTGISHKMYFDKSENTDFINTYSTFWNKKYSSIQKQNWNKKENFPIDWLPSTDEILMSTDPFYYYSKEDFNNIDLRFKSKFIILIHDRSELDLNINLEFIDYVSIKRIQSLEDLDINKKKIILEQGIYLVDIHHFQQDRNYKFSPSIIKNENGDKTDVFKNNLVFQPDQKISLIKYKIFNFLGVLYDILVSIIILFLLIQVFILIFNKKNLFKRIIYIYGLTYIFSLLTPVFIQNEKILIYKLNLSFSLSLIIFLSSLIIFKFKIFKKINFIDDVKFDNFSYFLCFILPLILIGFIRFNSEINGLSWWVPGDDGHTYQKFAREIVVDGEWLHSNAIYRQAPMYIYSFFHIIFGQSGFAQKIIEFYLVGLICFFTSKIIFSITSNQKLSVVFGIILLIIFTGEKYTTFIGKGYTEYYAAFLILLSVYLVQKYELNVLLIFILFIFSFIGLGLREDHIFIIFSIIFYSISIHKNFAKNFYMNLFLIIRKNFFKIFFFGLMVILSFFLLYLRNFLADPNSLKEIAEHPNLAIFLDLLNHPSFTAKNNFETSYFTDTVYHSYYRMFFGSVPFETPRLTSLFLLSGFLLCLYSLARPNDINFVHVGSVLSIITILFPYLFLVNHGYEPRYTIHYLPFCFIIISEYTNQYFKRSLSLNKL